MHIKRIIGAILAFLGVGAFIFSLIFFIIKFGGLDNRMAVTFGLVGILLFVSGVALVDKTPVQVKKQ